MQRRAARLLVWLAVLAATVAGASAAPTRHALVIGNAAYPDSPLDNPVNDATDMSRALDRLGFGVVLRTDAGRREMGTAIVQFAQRVKEGDVALVYFAGHGVQVGGQNYLLPTDAELDGEAAVEFSAIAVRPLLDTLQRAGARTIVVILDACRNNPFERRFRGAPQGLAAVDAARGSFIAYATAPGSVAADGRGRNGTFTAALLQALAVPGLKVEDVFKQVTDRVERETGGRQTPWTSSSLRGDLVLNLSVTINQPPTAPGSGFDPRALELAFWQSAERQDGIPGYESYLERYPDGVFAALARTRVAELRRDAGGGTPAPPLPPGQALDPIDRAFVVSAARAQIRDAPSLDATVAATLAEGDEVHVLGKLRDRDWFLVERNGRRAGWLAVGVLQDAQTWRQAQGTDRSRLPGTLLEEAALAAGRTPSFYSCSAHAQCAPGNVCVDNGGDGSFYCKPLCETDDACLAWPYPLLRCYPHRRVDGSPFAHRVCNDNPSFLRQ